MVCGVGENMLTWNTAIRAFAPPPDGTGHRQTIKLRGPASTRLYSVRLEFILQIYDVTPPIIAKAAPHGSITRTIQFEPPPSYPTVIPRYVLSVAHAP